MNWIWIDLETTGLDAASDDILECAVVVTDTDLTTLFAESWLVGPANLELMDDFVRDMHTKSGLLEDRARGPALDLKALETNLNVVADHFGCSKGPDFKGSPLCGSTVSFDRAFLKAHTPGFERRLSYRNIDVSSIHEVCSAWFDTSHDGGAVQHRAMPDVQNSIARLRWYRARHFNQHGRTR
jgi:oligoribonuclease